VSTSTGRCSCEELGSVSMLSRGRRRGRMRVGLRRSRTKVQIREARSSGEKTNSLRSTINLREGRESAEKENRDHAAGIESQGPKGREKAGKEPQDAEGAKKGQTDEDSDRRE